VILIAEQTIGDSEVKNKWKRDKEWRVKSGILKKTRRLQFNISTK